MKPLRTVTEAEVIAGFLHSEFHERDFDGLRDRWIKIVEQPNLSDADENILRRALLFRRRGPMWRELPPDTVWLQVEIEPSDVARLRIFPRAHWLTITNRLPVEKIPVAEVIERIQERRYPGRVEPILEKINAIGANLRQEHDPGAVVLLAENEQSPLQILEGNHRVTAALMVSPELLTQQFTVYCGFSKRMAECCWYSSTPATLFRYGLNRLRHLRDPEADVEAVARRLGYKPGKPNLARDHRTTSRAAESSAALARQSKAS